MPLSAEISQIAVSYFGSEVQNELKTAKKTISELESDHDHLLLEARLQCRIAYRLYMQDDELEAFVGRSDSQRAIIVSSMLIEPRLSYNGEGEGKHPYPVDSQSEWMMQCLFAAHRASNVPVGGQATLSRFLRHFSDRKRA